MPKHCCWLSDIDEEASPHETGDVAKGIQSYTGNLRDDDEVAPKLITHDSLRKVPAEAPSRNDALGSMTAEAAMCRPPP
jgi:hypothetical protein